MLHKRNEESTDYRNGKYEAGEEGTEAMKLTARMTAFVMCAIAMAGPALAGTFDLKLTLKPDKVRITEFLAEHSEKKAMEKKTAGQKKRPAAKPASKGKGATPGTGPNARQPSRKSVPVAEASGRAVQ